MYSQYIDWPKQQYNFYSTDIPRPICDPHILQFFSLLFHILSIRGGQQTKGISDTAEVSVECHRTLCKPSWPLIIMLPKRGYNLIDKVTTDTGDFIAEIKHEAMVCT